MRKTMFHDEHVSSDQIDNHKDERNTFRDSCTDSRCNNRFYRRRYTGTHGNADCVTADGHG